MEETHNLNRNDTERYLQLRRRAKRGLVASYIHEISPRRNGRPQRHDGAVRELIESTQGA